jgi:cell pole-organizing protein PopZ
MGDMSREPSMEDILSSIRRVIARDEAPGTPRDVRVAEADDILDLQDQEDRAAAAGIAAAQEAPADEDLVSEASADAARQSLEALTAAIAPPATATPAPPAPPAAGRTMEEVVLDALRPMLKDWLDTNLPPLVEAMVAKEISRITGRKF